MTARDQLADVIEDAIHTQHGPMIYRNQSLAAAHAVLGMIKPLVWSGFSSGAYDIQLHGGGIASLWFYGSASVEEEGPELLQSGYLTLVSVEDLKGIANAHHRAQILAALGLTIPE